MIQGMNLLSWTPVCSDCLLLRLTGTKRSARFRLVPFDSQVMEVQIAELERKLAQARVEALEKVASFGVIVLPVL